MAESEFDQNRRCDEDDGRDAGRNRVCYHRRNRFRQLQLDFYRRNGFRLLDYDYVQPPYAPGLPSVPLLLMSTDPALDPALAARTLPPALYRPRQYIGRAHR